MQSGGAHPATGARTRARGGAADSAHSAAHSTARIGEPRPYTRLRPGDRVTVVAPSGPVEPDRLAAGCAALRAMGLEVTLAKHVADTVNLDGSAPRRPGWQGLAGTDADRAADLTDAWCDPAVRAVVCARGGYGATRLLDLLDWNVLADAIGAGGPKLLHGSSDITALHAAFGTRLGVTTSFGPMVAGLLAAPDADAASVASFRSALFGGPARPVAGARALRPGRAEGLLTGGTLSMLVALLGTPDAPAPAAGRVVFLEDVTEAPYRIDRMLVQLLQSGWLDGAAGIALGSWEQCGDPAELAAVFGARLGPLGVPVLAGIPAGHGPHQHTLELGAPVRLDAGALTLDPLPGGAR